MSDTTTPTLPLSPFHQKRAAYLEEAGRAIYGSDWHRKLGADLHVSRATIGRWGDAEVPMTRQAASALRERITNEIYYMKERLATLERIAFDL